MKKLVLSFFAVLLFSILYSSMAYSEGRGLVEFAQLYMNRVDMYYEWDGENALDFSAEDIQSQVMEVKDNAVVVKCLAGNATVNLKTLEIERLDTIPFILSTDMTYPEWCGKCIVAMSALEYNTNASRGFAQSGEFEDAVQKCIDIWNNQINISDAYAKAQNGIDVLLYIGDIYHYYLHFESEPAAAISIIASVEELKDQGQAVAEVVVENAPNTLNETDPTEFVYGSDGKQVRINAYIGSSQEVVIPSVIDGLPVTMIGAEAFKGCSSMTSIVIPEGVIEIGEAAFKECKNLKSATIPSTLKYLSRECFKMCFRLSELRGLENIDTFGTWCLQSTSLSTELVFDKDTHIMWGAFDRTDIYGVRFTGGRIKVECDAFGDSPVRYCYIDDACELEFIDYSTSTEFGAFYDCEKMTEIVIPESVHHFPPHTFEGCRMLTVYAPAGSTAEQYARESFISVDTDAYEEKVLYYQSFAE